MIKEWFTDGAFRSILKNAFVLFSSNVGSALIGLLSLALASRTLGPDLFGILIIIQTYTRTISALLQFQSWQVIVRYGAPALVRRELPIFKQVVNFSFALDIVSSVLAFSVAIMVLPWVSHKIGIRGEDFWLAMGFCTLIPLLASATPTGILRSLDRFDLLAIQEIISPVIRVIGCIVTYYGQFGFCGFVLSWYLGSLIGGATCWVFAGMELGRRKIRGAFRPSLIKPARQIKGVWNFVWVTHLAYTLGSIKNSGSNFMVGILLGADAAGLFKIALTFYDAAATPGQIMEKSFYPEIMRLNPREKRPWLLGIRTAFTAVGFGLCVAIIGILLGNPLIDVVFGDQYSTAFTLLEIMLGAIVLSMAAVPLESLLFMASRQRQSLCAQSLATLIYAVLLIALSLWLGIVGAALAYVGSELLIIVFSLLPTMDAYRNRHKLPFVLPEETRQ
ncbi:hypothetical protein LMG33818_002172 [Halomonadaceae bacterium LMG 33818]|uniref:lipopolysaccharide biosynthesis protein n=1 Tax=Cernens ardua TaxID=3402176 RepID=UPI003EDBB18A